VAVLLGVHPDAHAMGLTPTSLSLGGIALSIGVLVDGADRRVENAYKKLQLVGSGRRKGRLPRGAAGGAPRRLALVLFFSLL